MGADNSKIILTARSGRSALAYRFQKLGFEFNRDDVDTLYDSFLQIADKQKEILDKDLQSLAFNYKTVLVQSA